MSKQSSFTVYTIFYQLFLKSFNIKSYFIVKKNKTITLTYCKLRQKLYLRYATKLLIANKFRLMVTYYADSIRDLTSFGG